MKYKNIYPFVNEPAEEEKIINSNIYKAIEDIEERKDYTLFKSLYKQFSFGVEYLIQGYYLLLGYKFNVKKYCKRYLVKLRYDLDNNTYREYYAPNKTCLYNAIGGKYNVIKIIEI